MAMRKIVVALFLLLFSPALAALSDVLFQLELDCSTSTGNRSAATVELANGGTQPVAVSGLTQAQVFVNVTTHRMGVAYLTYQVKSAGPVELLTAPQVVVVMGQAPPEFRFRVPGQEVCLRTTAFRVATPGVPVLDSSAPMPMVPGMMPGMMPGPSDMPGVQLPEGFNYETPPGFVLPGSSRL